MTGEPAEDGWWPYRLARGAFRFVALIAVLYGVSFEAPPAHGAAQAVNDFVLYSHPILAPVADPFRPPAHIGAAGNRGLEYANGDGLYVTAAADGWIAYAGPVAGRKVVSIEHADGVRTTYSGFAEVWASDGFYVWRGWAIGLANPGFHFGAKMNDHYLDPQVLIDASERPDRAILVAPPD